MNVAVETAVILAAGTGSRFGALSAGTPKGMIRLGGQSIVEESIEQLRQAGIRRIIIGTGYGAEHYEALAARSDGIVECHFNPDFAESGSMYTLATLADRIREDFLLLESDLVYEMRALELLQAAGAGTTMLVSGFTKAGDEVFVEADSAGRLVALSKHRETLGENVIGELVGITRVSVATLRQMVIHAARQFLTSLRVEYEQMLATVSSFSRVRCEVIPDLIWTEIDDAAQLARAQRDIYPRIRR